MALVSRREAAGLAGLFGIGAVARFVPTLPQLAATQVLTIVNTIIGLGGFGSQIALSSLLPAGATIPLPLVGVSILPAIAGIGTTIAIIVGVARRRAG